MDSQIVISSGEPDIRVSLFGDHERTSLILDEAANTTVSIERHRELRFGEFSDILQMAAEWAGSAGAAVTASWLYEHLKDKKVRISIDRKPVTIAKDELHYALSPVDAAVSSAGGEIRRPQFTAWAGANRVTLAIVFTDVVGSTALGEAIGDGEMNRVRRAHFSESQKLITENGGREVKTIGDSVMAAFHSVEAALDFALALHITPGDPRLQVRAGIHIGPISVDGSDLFGGTVNLAARITHEITGPEIWLSDDAKKHLMLDRAPHRRYLRWTEHPAVKLKGFNTPVTLWSLVESEG